MSIKKSQAILKCFIDIKSSVSFTLSSEDETMFCDTKDRSTTSTRFSQIVTSDRAWAVVILLRVNLRESVVVAGTEVIKC